MCQIYTYDEIKEQYPTIFDNVPVDIVELCKKMNIDLIGVNKNDDFCGAIKYNPQTEKFSIYVNSTHSYGRQRFTIAHELAHYFQHNEMVRVLGVYDKTMNRNKGFQDNQEHEANRLASKILMPSEALLKEIKIEDTKIDIEYLAKKYGVSEAAMGYRLTNLGVL